MREALRINSPISLLPARVCSEDAVLAATARDGTQRAYAVPAGTPIVPNVYAVHHHRAYYPREAAFLPERFLASAAGAENSEVKVQPGAFIPFGTGPRQCTARQFSLFEQKTLLAMLLLRYEFALPAGSEHARGLKNEFGAFGLSIPHELDIEFTELSAGEGEEAEKD